MVFMAALMVVVLGVALAAPSDPYSIQPVHSFRYKQPGMPHDFQYNVRDDYSGTNFGHSENSDGNTVRGSYNVDLPDGRKQTCLPSTYFRQGRPSRSLYKALPSYSPHHSLLRLYNK
nr:uncharacterized protein LOC123761151 [Procambarus clarkii]